MEKIKLEIIGLSESQLKHGSYALVLAEESGKRRLPIVIGNPEAHAIAWELEKMPMTRPMTHDLFKSFARAFDFTLEEIVISDFREGVFYAQIICTDGIRQKSIDARPSDAVALAVRFDVPIYIHDIILTEAGINTEEDLKDQGFEPDEESEQSEVPLVAKPEDKLRSLSLDELTKMLQEALSQENYEMAALIRDELDRRS
ncbi:MAG: bifunctional nuclease family protein [Spirosomataceae bacterium]